ncbi:MAG: tetratricopeptide repeat protein [Anaeromyxobacteraceae bacterium]
MKGRAARLRRAFAAAVSSGALAAAVLAAAQGGGEARPGTDAGAESPRALLERVEGLKAAIRDRPKTPDILLALGNLYLQNGRPLDAIDWYRQALEQAAPALARLDALAAARSGRPSARAREACDRTTAKRSYGALVAAAERARRAGASSDEAYCLAAAVAPALEAQARRGDAFVLAGNPDQALADARAVLAREPDHAGALFLSGALLAAGAAADPAKRAGAVDAWRRFLRAHPDDPRAQRVREELGALDARAARTGATPDAR